MVMDLDFENTEIWASVQCTVISYLWYSVNNVKITWDP